MTEGALTEPWCDFNDTPALVRIVESVARCAHCGRTDHPGLAEHAAALRARRAGHQQWVRRDSDDGELFEAMTRGQMRGLVSAKANGRAPEIDRIDFSDREIRVTLSENSYHPGKTLVYRWEE